MTPTPTPKSLDEILLTAIWLTREKNGRLYITAHDKWLKEVKAKLLKWRTNSVKAELESLKTRPPRSPER